MFWFRKLAQPDAQAGKYTHTHTHTSVRLLVMFYTYVDKEKSNYYDSWEPRQLAFDTMRRHLYYSEPIPSDLQVHIQDGVKTEGVEPKQLVYLKKFKLYSLKIVARKSANQSEYWIEKDFYRLELECESRTLATGEFPPRGPCLCPSAEPIRPPCRASPPTQETLHDPYFHFELFEATSIQFRTLRQQKEAARLNAISQGRIEPPVRTLTVSTPRKWQDKESVSKTKIMIRCRNEIEFHRLTYLLFLVLGHDRVHPLPYRGLPPFDPRNGIAFGHIPMDVLPRFAALDRTVFYSFIKGDLFGVVSGSLRTVVTDVYCVMTHDMVYFMSRNGKIPRWARLLEVIDFFYNANCPNPFVALVSEDPSPDFLFAPKCPVFNNSPMCTFDAGFEVSRMAHIMHNLCYSSVLPRRVVGIHEVTDQSAHLFWARMNTSSKPLVLHPGNGYDSSMQCPIPKERLVSAWTQIQGALSGVPDVDASSMAVPIYANSSGDLKLTEEQVERLQTALGDIREADNEVVGLPVNAVRQLVESQEANPDLTRLQELSNNLWAADRDVRNGSESSADASSGSGSSSASGGGRGAPSYDSSDYRTEGARYYTREEAASGADEGAATAVADDHVAVLSPPMMARRRPSQLNVKDSDEHFTGGDPVTLFEILNIKEPEE